MISYIIPVYNTSKYLCRCILSVEKQVGSKEIILVDDGSTDDSGNICNELAQKYSDIKVIHKQNGGLASARNVGIRNATGEYIAFVDSDDYIEDCYGEVLEGIVKGNAPDVVYFSWKCLNEQGKNISTLKMNTRPGLYQGDRIRKELLPKMIAPKRFADYGRDNIMYGGAAWSHLYRLSFLKTYSLEFPSERVLLNEDFAFNLNIYIHAKSVVVVNNHLYNYIKHEGSLTTVYLKNIKERKVKLIEFYYNKLKENNLYQELQKEYACFVIANFQKAVFNEANPKNPEKAIKAVKNIRELLNNELFIASLNKGDVDGLSIGKKIGVLLMRYKCAGILFILYRIKQQKG